MDVAATIFKAAVTLTPGDALAIAGELRTAAAAQLKPKAWLGYRLLIDNGSKEGVLCQNGTLEAA